MPPTRTLVSALPKGHVFDLATFNVSAEQAAAYLAAVGDRTDYGEALPPLAIVALALQALQEQVALPDGALHTGQEVTHHAIARAGAQLTMRSEVGMRSERQGFVITALDYEVSSAEGPVVSARTTIMAPGAAS